VGRAKETVETNSHREKSSNPGDGHRTGKGDRSLQRKPGKPVENRHVEGYAVPEQQRNEGPAGNTAALQGESGLDCAQRPLSSKHNPKHGPKDVQNNWGW
jgi:hypothetical protein